MKENKKDIIKCAILAGIFLIYTILVKVIDVAPIGPQKSEVGFSKLNGWFSKLIGNNMAFYYISEVLGYIAISIVVLFGLKGLMQLIKRKNLFKVDFEILALGVFYILVLGVYIFFENVIINYRPVLNYGGLEASYPSSHTVLTICVSLSAILVNKTLIKNEKIRNKIKYILLGLAILTTITRIISGAHWFTDIVGGMLISATLISMYATALKIYARKKEKNSI